MRCFLRREKGMKKFKKGGKGGSFGQEKGEGGVSGWGREGVRKARGRKERFGRG